jgi:tripartite motif-containing protein 71
MGREIPILSPLKLPLDQIPNLPQDFSAKTFDLYTPARSKARRQLLHPAAHMAKETMMNFRVIMSRGGFLSGVWLLSLVLLFVCCLMGAGAALAETAPPFVAKWGSQGSGNSQFNDPLGVAIDSAGNVYVADSNNNRIQKFSASGMFITKWGSSGTGDGQLNMPYGVAVDSAGNVYVADYGNSRIQKFTANGTFVTKWGSYGAGDGQFHGPGGIAVDSAGNVYVADYGNSRIQKFTADGTLVTKWHLYQPRDITVDASGNVYAINNFYYSGWWSGYYQGIITKFNNNGLWLNQWTISPAFLQDVCIDGSGDVYVSDSINSRLLKYSGNGTLLCEWGSYGSGDGQVNYPEGLAADKVGNIYVADSGNNRIQKFSYPRPITFLGKWGQYAYSNLENTDLDHPWGVATDSAGNVYVTNREGYHLVKKFNSTGGFLAKWGGFGSGQGQFKFPMGISLDGANNVYVADWENQRIQKFNSNGGYLKEWKTGFLFEDYYYSEDQGYFDYFWPTYPRISRFINGFFYTFLDFGRNYGWTVKYDSEGSFVQKVKDYHFDDPHDLAVDAQGYIYVAHSGQARVEKMDSNGNFVGSWSGIFNCPRGITFDDQGYVYVTDDGNHRVVKLTSNGEYVSQWGSYGTGDGQFNAPHGITFHGGNFYVVDHFNHRIQKFGYLPVLHKPIIAGIGNKTVNEGQTLNFTVTAVDVDGGPLTYSISNKPTTAGFDPATHTFTWTPGYNESGVYPNVTFTVTDNSTPQKSVTETITITVGNVNQAPVLSQIGPQTVKEDETLQFTLSATDPDAGDTLTFSISDLPAGAAFDAQTRTFTWKPSFTQGGQNYTVRFTVTDNGSPPRAASEEVTITVGNVNRPPVMATIGNKTVDEDKTLEFTISATDPDENEVALSFAASNIPAGAAFNPATRTFSWTPGYDQAGEYTVVFTVTDSGGLSDSETVTIAVGNVNRSPVLDPIGPKTVPENQPLTFPVTGHDPDGDNLTFNAENLPPGATFSGQTFEWTPTFDQAGNYTVLFEVQDKGSPVGVVVEQVTITVGNENRAPVFDPVGTKQAAPGEKVEFYVQAGDPDGDALVYSTGALPSGASFNPDTRLFSWTPGYSQAGSYTVDFSATDNSSPPLTGKTSVVISVSSPTPSELIAGILQKVAALGLAKEVENSYVANLKKVNIFIAGGKKKAAADQLEAFIKKVNTDMAQGKIGPASGADFIKMATELINMIGT